MNPEEATKEAQEKEEAKPEENKAEPEEEIKEEPKPKEPEVKIPTDFSADLAKMEELKTQGNAIVQTDLDGAIKKYEEGHNYYKYFITKGNSEREYNPQIREMETKNKLVMSNLALCLTKKAKYEEAIKYDLSIIAIDPLFDKSFARLYKNYKALNNIDFACHFGMMLKTNFTAETIEKHKELVTEIEEEDKKLKDKYEEKRKKEAKDYRNDIIMKFVPAIVLGITGLIYFLFFRKAAPASAPAGTSGFNNTTSAFNETDFTLNETENDLNDTNHVLNETDYENASSVTEDAQ